jgi:hypothetical protein
VGISAIQDTLNAVYRIQDSRSFIKARTDAIGLTVLLTLIVTLGLASMLAGDVAAALAYRFIDYRLLAVAVAAGARIVAWAIATALLTLAFAVIYYWAPDVFAGPDKSSTLIFQYRFKERASTSLFQVRAENPFAHGHLMQQELSGLDHWIVMEPTLHDVVV